MVILDPSDSVFVVEAGDVVRICSEYNGAVRKLFWLEVEQDGSLYTGFSTGEVLRQVLIPTQLDDGGFRFRWDEVEPIENRDEKTGVSFHASGIIHSSDGRSVGVPLRLLKHRTYLCRYLPPHPDRWPVREGERLCDLVLGHLLTDDCPLDAALYFQPASNLPVLESDLDQGSFVLRIGYKGVDHHQRVLLHLVFQRRPRALTWPPTWYLGWPTIKASSPSSDKELWFEG